MHGEWTFWREDGKTDREEYYLLREKNGEWTFYDENGNPLIDVNQKFSSSGTVVTYESFKYEGTDNMAFNLCILVKSLKKSLTHTSVLSSISHLELTWNSSGGL